MFAFWTNKSCLCEKHLGYDLAPCIVYVPPEATLPEGSRYGQLVDVQALGGIKSRRNDRWWPRQWLGDGLNDSMKYGKRWMRKRFDDAFACKGQSQACTMMRVPTYETAINMNIPGPHLVAVVLRSLKPRPLTIPCPCHPRSCTPQFNSRIGAILACCAQPLPRQQLNEITTHVSVTSSMHYWIPGLRPWKVGWAVEADHEWFCNSRGLNDKPQWSKLITCLRLFYTRKLAGEEQNVSTSDVNRSFKYRYDTLFLCSDHRAGSKMNKQDKQTSKPKDEHLQTKNNKVDSAVL